MAQPGISRERLARKLNAAYVDGLLSERTLSHRLDLLFGSRLIDPAGIVGDLSRRAPQRDWGTALARAVAATVRAAKSRRNAAVDAPSVLLALDWTGGQDELLIGRHRNCDVVLSSGAVSRRHARLTFRDGKWVIQDLGSTNGTTVNHERVGRCQLQPGDHLVLGDQRVTID